MDGDYWHYKGDGDQNYNQEKEMQKWLSEEAI